MNPLHIKETLRDFEQALNTRDKARIIELVDKQAVFRTPASPEPLYGGEGYYWLVDFLCSGFSDAQWHIEDILAEGNRAAVHWRLTGTHDGAFLGAAPTQRTISVGLMNIYVFNEQGLICEDIAAEGMIGILRGIGLLSG